MSTKITTFNPHLVTIIEKNCYAVNKLYCGTMTEFTTKISNIIGQIDLTMFDDVEIRYYDVPIHFMVKIVTYIDQKISGQPSLPCIINNIHQDFNIPAINQWAVICNVNISDINSFVKIDNNSNISPGI